MIIRVFDRGYTTNRAYRYKIQKRIFFIWICVVETDSEECAIDQFNSISGPRVLLRKKV